MGKGSGQCLPVLPMRRHRTAVQQTGLGQQEHPPSTRTRPGCRHWRPAAARPARRGRVRPVVDAVLRCVAATTALGRVGEAADIADAVAFLVSPDARWGTGGLLDVADPDLSVAASLSDLEGQLPDVVIVQGAVRILDVLQWEGPG
ncbi:hypothetical protein GCM10023170_012720 [Phytohabitans houttuyneae]